MLTIKFRTKRKISDFFLFFKNQWNGAVL